MNLLQVRSFSLFKSTGRNTPKGEPACRFSHGEAGNQHILAFIAKYGFSLLLLGALPACGISQPIPVSADEASPAVSKFSSINWKERGSLEKPRELLRLVKLKDGRVLAIGSGSALLGTASTSTEIFDPKTNQWSLGPELNVPRRDPEVIKLPDGRVLAIGGSSGPEFVGTETVEALDRDGKRWAMVDSMSVPRTAHAATLLGDGRVLVTGGSARPGVFHKSAEVYDPRKNVWRPAGKMTEIRSKHGARTLHDGSALVFGGGTEITATRTAELFNPKTMEWTSVGDMMLPRWGFLSTVLPDGRVLVAGGRIPIKEGYRVGGTAVIKNASMIIHSGVEIYDPKTKSWKNAAAMQYGRTLGFANPEPVHLPDGLLLVTGGRTNPAPYHGTNSVEVYDAKANQWTLLKAMNMARSYQFALRLNDGRVLVVGGRGVDFLPITQTETIAIPRASGK